MKASSMGTGAYADEPVKARSERDGGIEPRRQRDFVDRIRSRFGHFLGQRHARPQEPLTWRRAGLFTEVARVLRPARAASTPTSRVRWAFSRIQSSNGARLAVEPGALSCVARPEMDPAFHKAWIVRRRAAGLCPPIARFGALQLVGSGAFQDVRFIRGSTNTSATGQGAGGSFERPGA